MTINTGDILKVVIEYAVPGASTALNIFNYVFDGASQDDQDVFDALLNFFTSDWADTWSDIAAASATCESMQVQVVDSTGTVLRDLGTDDILVDGIVPGENTSAAVSGFIQANTAIPQVRGSKYVPGLGEGSIGNGILTLPAFASLSLLLTDYLQIVSVAAGANLFPGVISTREGGFRAFAGSGSSTNIPAYQRRRKPNVGI